MHGHIHPYFKLDEVIPVHYVQQALSKKKIKITPLGWPE